jgi:hypothetical protein
MIQQIETSEVYTFLTQETFREEMKKQKEKHNLSFLNMLLAFT